jgi:putative nucleotidyltransferase with HDIG domain
VKRGKIDLIMSKVKSFPGIPAIAARLTGLLQDPNSSASQIEEILRYDPGLTANILKLTNSAYFGIPSKVSSVKQAVVLLGWKRLSQLVMAMCMSKLMKQRVPGYDLPQGELWRHSIAVSLAAEQLVKALQIKQTDEVFTAALLHDVGKLILGKFVSEDLQEIQDMVAKGFSFEVAEFMVIGIDHAAIGAQLLRNWSFPQELTGAVQWHHDPESCKGDCTLSEIVHVANAVGLMIGFGKGNDDHHTGASSAVTRKLGLSLESLEQLADQTLQGFNSLSESLGLY